MKNYQITTSDEIGKGGAKTKAKANLAAIHVLKEIESEKRRATPDEQTTLIKFSGWGSVVDIFTNKPEWAALQGELKDLLTGAEYESASAAILNAHYTAPAVATAIYEGLERLGFDGGKILDPSMGATGVFEGTLPDTLRENSKIVGIELDSLSGRIARNLYPEASVHIRGFEKTVLPDNRFDLAISNVPFSEVGVSDPEYDGLPIRTLHDYFFVKALDKVRPGGLTAFITSTGTMQSASGEGVRELLSDKANLVGAMRLPSTAFKQVAGTEVTTDLIILQKLGDGVEPNGVDWTKLQPSTVMGADGNALPVNEYYARNPQMMLGTLADDKLHPGRLALHGDGRDIQLAMREAFSSLPEGIYQPASEASRPQQVNVLIPPDLQEQVKPNAYVLHEDQVMQRAGHYLEPTELEGKKLERMKGMLAIRDAVQSVFTVQLQNGSERSLQEAQATLNQTYDEFTKANGFMHQRANKLVFQEDPDYPLLLALENYDQETKTATKTAIFSDRVIQSHQEKTEADSPKEALLYSLNERGRVDLDYIAGLVDQSSAEVTQALQRESLIFLDPQKNQWVPEDEYLSGNVKDKLCIAQESAAEDPQYAVNVEALQAVQPPLIPPGDIGVRLGSAWVPPADIQNFTQHLLDTAGTVDVQYSSVLSAWSVDADYQVSGSVKNTKVHGTDRVGALRLIELGLNLKDPVVYDRVDDRLVVNQEDTAAARMKLEEIKATFKDWVWQDPERTERLTDLYNEKFNTTRPRQYNGAHLELNGSNPAIQLRPHQQDAIWRVLQEGNTLLAHCVGAGKTFEMIAAAMEQKRLGLVNKPMFVVPNHLLEQWAADFKRLYPNSNVLAATKDDSSAKNRQELMSRIATGNWDAVIVTHSAFGKLKMSQDAQLDFYHAELAEVSEAADEAKGGGGSRSMIKEFERQKKRLKKQIDKISQSGKDNTVTFEQLGVDQLIVDEAHYFKNLGYQTKMYGIAGLPNTSSDRAFDMFMKCRYLGEQRGEGKGVVFATGTPVSNSMAELYTMQRFLQPQALREMGLSKFDAWASTFGETVTAPEITPAGGYKVKTRFSQFVNLPELMNTVRQVADIKTAEMLNLPTPELKGGKPEVVAVAASEMQLAFVEELAQRAEKLGNVDPRDDNMLLITTDGRKASLDMRLVNPYIPHERNKIDQLVEDTYQFWDETKAQKTTHLIFCDLGTPKADAASKDKKEIDVQKHFTVYGYIKEGLIERGIPASEVAFAQDFKTDAKKLEMQQKFNAGKIRVLISGPQLETGFNGQKKLGLESHLTVPWRPDQVEQRDGRIMRQGNENPEVQIRRYVTQGRGGRPSFDSYMWQTLETKKKFVSQVMAGNSEVRSMEDVAGAALTYAEVKAIATGNPLIMEKATIDNQIAQLSAQKRSHLNQNYAITRELKVLPERIDEIVETIAALKADAQKVPDMEALSLTVQGVEFTDLREAMKPIKARALEKQTAKDYSTEPIGQVGGFDLALKRERWGDDIQVVIQGEQNYECKIEHTYVGTAANLTGALKSIEPRGREQERRLAESQKRLVELSEYSDVPFPKELELQAALKRQVEINTELGLNKDNAQAAIDVEEGDETEPAKVEPTITVTDEPTSEIDKPISATNEPLVNSLEPSEIVAADQQSGRIEKRIATFLEKAGIREAVTAGKDYRLKIENGSDMPLVVERQLDHLYLTQSFQRRGDTCIDSEMVFKIEGDGQLQLKETAAYSEFRGGADRRCDDRVDRIFAQTFSRKIQTQGFAEAVREQTIEAPAIEAEVVEPETTPAESVKKIEPENTSAAEMVESKATLAAAAVEPIEPDSMPVVEIPAAGPIEPDPIAVEIVLENTPAAESEVQVVDPVEPETTPTSAIAQPAKAIANPLYERYRTQKEETPDAIVFVQTPIGYQTFGQDAERYAEITGANLGKTDTQAGQLSTVLTSGWSLESRIDQVTGQGIEIAVVEKDLTVQLHQPPVALAPPAADLVELETIAIETVEPEPILTESAETIESENTPVVEVQASEPIEPVAQSETSDNPAEEVAEVESTDLLSEDSVLLRYEKGSLIVLPREMDQLQAIFQSGDSDTQIKESIEQIFDGEVPPSHLASVVEAVMSDCQFAEAQPLEAQPQAIAEEIEGSSTMSAEVINSEPPATLTMFPTEDSLDSSPEEADDYELAGFQIRGDGPGSSLVLCCDRVDLVLLPEETRELIDISNSGASDTQMAQRITQLFEPRMLSEHMESIVETAIGDIQSVEELADTLAALNTPLMAILPDDARETELARGEAILKIAAQTYAFMETQGKVLPDDALEMWTAQGNHYDITYNPTNANFFVEGKNGSEMAVQSIEGKLDPDSTDAVSQKDVERFQATVQVLSQHAFEREQPPAQTQAIAQAKWERAVAAAASVLPSAAPTPSPVAGEEQSLFPVDRYASESPGQSESSAAIDPSWEQPNKAMASQPVSSSPLPQAVNGSTPPSSENPKAEKLPAVAHPPLVDSLQQWRQQAQDLGRSERYVEKIEKLISAVESDGAQAFTDKAAAAQTSDRQNWHQQVETVTQQAQFILENMGEADSTGTHYNGKTYAISQSPEGSLSVEASGRGQILRVDGNDIQCSTVNATDAARFQSFARQVSAVLEKQFVSVGREQ